MELCNNVFPTKLIIYLHNLLIYIEGTIPTFEEDAALMLITYPYNLRASIMWRSKVKEKKKSINICTFHINTLLKKGYSNCLRTAFFRFCGSNFSLFVVRNFALFSMYRFILQFPEIQGQNLCLYKLFKKTLRAQVLTHSWSLTDCLPPVGRPCQSQRYGCCSSHPGAGSRVSGLCDCTHKRYY